MSREQADDYDDKRRTIMDAAASLFSKQGYPNANLKDVAQACNASKSMLYHYFATKDDLLFAILREHLEQTIAAIEKIDPAGAPEQRLRIIIETYTKKSTEARTRHIVAMNDVKFLPKATQKQIINLERRLAKLFEQALVALDPSLTAPLAGPSAMLLIGMLNWTDLWYRPSGPLKPKELCDYIARLFLNGFLRR